MAAPNPTPVRRRLQRRPYTGVANPNYRGGYDTACAVCTKPVHVKPSHFGRAWYTCSKVCCAKQLATTTTGPDHWRFQGGDVGRTCQACGVSYYQTRKEFNQNPGKYCSRACLNTGRQRRTNVTCVVCLTDFEVKAHKTNAKFCSRSCKRKFQTKERTPEELARIRLNRRMSSLIGQGLRHRKNGRTWLSLVPYTVADLMAHLEAKFLPGMTWANAGRGGWHIDHVRPRSSFAFTDAADPQFKECWSLANLQPLWQADNLKKGSTWAAPAPD